MIKLKRISAEKYDHRLVKTDAELARYCFASKVNYGPGIKEDMIDFFPTEWFSNAQVFQPIINELLSMHRFMEKKFLVVFDIEIDLMASEYDQLTCTNILCFFLIYTFQHVSGQFYRELVVFICFLRRFFNIEVEKREIEQGKKITKKDFSEKEDANLIPILLNRFVIDQFQLFLEDAELFKTVENLKLLRPGEVNFNKLISLSKFLADWLYFFHFTEYTLMFVNPKTIIPEA